MITIVSLDTGCGDEKSFKFKFKFKFKLFIALSFTNMSVIQYIT